MAYGARRSINSRTETCSRLATASAIAVRWAALACGVAISLNFWMAISHDIGRVKNPA